MDKIFTGLIYVGMPVVAAYHLLCGSVFLNTAATDADGLEKMGNQLLIPVQFLLCGKEAVKEKGEYHLEQRFTYTDFLPFKSTAAVLTVPLSLPLGSLCKGLSYLSPKTVHRHQLIEQASNSQKVNSNVDHYEALGLHVREIDGVLDSPSYKRRAGEENHLALEKELLKEIVTLFKQNDLPFWVECGTCLGAYRYGGVIPWDNDVDVACLLPDFENVWNVLNALDKTKYHVQDWSSRIRPKTYIRVYLKENHNHVDIYFFKIDPEAQTLSYVLSNHDSSFMIDSWKIRESRFTVPSAYETIFPLKKAKLDGIEVYVPGQTKKYLQERYGENIDPPMLYNEVTGNYEKDLSHPYWQLPYVVR